MPSGTPAGMATSMFLGKEQVRRVAEQREGRVIFLCLSTEGWRKPGIVEWSCSKLTLHTVILHTSPPQATSEGIYGPLLWLQFNNLIFLSLSLSLGWSLLESLEWLNMSSYHSSVFLSRPHLCLLASHSSHELLTLVRKKDAAFKETLHAGM